MGVVCILALAIASPAAATVVEDPLCCFCAVDEDAGQVPFCGLISSRSQDAEIEQQCRDQGGLGLKCLARLDNNANGQTEASCTAALVEEGVNCPVRSGAPAASAPMLAVLAAVFAAVGIAATRRRRPSSGA